jgi:hypothetical protein
MRQLITIAITILSVFTAIGLACAVRIALKPQPRQCDPFFHPFGDVPGFSDQQLREIARRSAERIARDPLRRSFATRDLVSAGAALRTEADGVGASSQSPRAHAVRNFFLGWRHA